MGNFEYKQFTRRRLPHIQPPDSTLFLTFRLAGSIPKSYLREYRAKKIWIENQLERLRSKPLTLESSSDLQYCIREMEDHKKAWFIKSEELLHRANFGPTWMKNSAVADTVAQNLYRLDGNAYRLDAFSIMSNHVHAVFATFLSTKDLREVFDSDGRWFYVTEHPALAKIMHSIKGRSARECNLIIGRSGSFCEHESFDHVIRHGKFEKTVR